MLEQELISPDIHRIDCIYATPRSAALFLSPLPRAAARLMPTQLNRNPANLKNAIREIDRSSTGVREDEKMERSTVGVTREFDVSC